MTKEEILTEVRRTAEANGGQPLGKERFSKTTGIKDSDWFGKYWVRWNEILSEAGYEPNEMQSALKDDFVLEELALLTRELRHVPVKGELRIHKRKRPGFPNEKVFERFGPKAQLIVRLAEYCKEHTGMEDVLALCGSKESRTRATATTKESEPEIGFVYLLKAGRFYKIGRSNAAGRRERELAIQLPQQATNVHVIRTDDPVGIEAYWHQRFSEKRRNGEWFELSHAEVASFLRRKFM